MKNETSANPNATGPQTCRSKHRKHNVQYCKFRLHTRDEHPPYTSRPRHTLRFATHIRNVHILMIQASRRREKQDGLVTATRKHRQASAYRDMTKSQGH